MAQASYAQFAPFARIPSVFPYIVENKTATAVFADPVLPPHLPQLSSKQIRDEYLSKAGRVLCTYLLTNL